MSLQEKSDENKRIAKKCIEMKAYNAGISRVYYSLFQCIEHILENSPVNVFNYEQFLKDNNIKGDHIPHGKMQQAMAEYLIACNKKVNLGNITIYDNLYRKRRIADYSGRMFLEQDLKDCLREMDIVLSLVV